MHGRFYREVYPANQNFQKVQFENEQVRVTRLVCAAGKRLDVSTSPTEPALLVSLSPSKFKVHENKGKRAALELEIGQTAWVAAAHQKGFENSGTAQAELLRFDFKTKPLSKDVLEKDKKHEHSKK